MITKQPHLTSRLVLGTLLGLALLCWAIAFVWMYKTAGFTDGEGYQAKNSALQGSIREQIGSEPSNAAEIDVPKLKLLNGAAEQSEQLAVDIREKDSQVTSNESAESPKPILVAVDVSGFDVLDRAEELVLDRNSAVQSRKASDDLAKEKAAQEQAALEKAAQEQAAQEQAAQEQAAQEQAAQEQAAQEQAAQEQAAQEKAAQEQAALEKAAQEQAAQEQAAQGQAAQEQAAQEQAAQEKAAQEQAAKEKAAQEQAAKEKAALEKDSQRGNELSAEASDDKEARARAALARYEQLRREEIGVLAQLSARIRFETNSATINRRIERVLDRMFDPLYLYSDLKVKVSVATNESTVEATNNLLSRSRALAIVAYMVNRGIEVERFSIFVESGYRLSFDTHRVSVLPEDLNR